MSTYRGKIGRLPLVLRDEVCRRLEDGQNGPQILPWLNGLPQVAEFLAREFQGDPVSAQNLSDWRRGGYKDWLGHNDRLLRTRALAEKAIELARAGGGTLTEGAAQIAAGEILGVMEKFTGDTTIEEITKAVEPLVKLRAGDQATAKLRQAEKDLGRKDEELRLAQDKFRRDTAETVLKSARDEAVQRIATSPLDHSAQLEAVGKHLFGDLWK